MSMGAIALFAAGCASAFFSAHVLSGCAIDTAGELKLKRLTRQKLVGNHQVADALPQHATWQERILMLVLKRESDVVKNRPADRKATRSKPEADAALLVNAGIRDGVDAAAVRRVRIVFAEYSALAFGLIGLLFGIAGMCFGLLLGAMIGFRLPDKILKRCAHVRRTTCDRELPNLLEIVALGTQAGMSFDASLEAYIMQNDTLLAREMSHSYHSYMQGIESREDALGRFAYELDSSAFRRFCEAVVQSLMFGAPLCDVLRDLGNDIRAEYKASVSERIAKAPVKMLIPMGTLILPAMLLLVLGPVVLNMMSETM